jgi:Fur family ferric uptake transcriptional regulator
MSKKEQSEQPLKNGDRTPPGQVAEAWRQFTEFLKNRGDRITQARRIVFNRVFERHDHFCADDLAADLVSGPNHVSRGTVYRTLELMVKAGLVRKLRDSDVHAHYEHTFGHPEHEHMICDRCGTFIEFRSRAIPQEIHKICRTHGFEMLRHRTVIFGICAECRAGAEAESPRGQTD